AGVASDDAGQPLGGVLSQDTEALGLDPQGDVELAAEVLEGHGRRELDDLRLGEVAADPSEETLGHFLARDRHRLRVAERHPLAVGEERALGRPLDLTHLVLRRSRLHPTGCIDAYSEWTLVSER